jgi:octaprenyl-diphosphate synthase
MSRIATPPEPPGAEPVALDARRPTDRPLEPSGPPPGRAPDQQAFLDAVARRIEAALSSSGSSTLSSASLESAARRLLLASRAKRARALLCAAVGRHLGASPTALVDCAAAIELVHGASLLHDDVVDDADLRRGEPTARAEGGNAFAVLCGDLVLARALAVLGVHGPAVVDATVAVVEEMTRAALVEIEDRGRLDVPVARWTAMAMGKTGALFGLCARLPGLLVADAGAVVDHQGLVRALRSFGVAFQIVDDVLDLRGGDAGKARGQDLREKNPSLPILCALAADPTLAAALQRIDDGVDDDVLFPLCDRVLAAGLGGAVDAAGACVQDALAALGEDAAGLGDVIAWATHLVGQALGGVRIDEGLHARSP